MPINIGDKSRPLEHILATEGEWRTIYGDGSIVVPVASQNNTQTIVQSETAYRPDGSAQFGIPYIGRCMWVEYVTVSASVDGMYQLTSYTGQTVVNGTTKYSPWGWRGLLKANIPLVIPVRQFWKHDRFENNIGAVPTISLQSRSFTPALTVDTAVVGAVTLGGYVITDDLNVYAPKTMLVVGDSLSYLDGANSPTDASGNPSSAEFCWTFMVRDWLSQNGTGDIRLASIAQPGLTTSHVRLQTSRGKFDSIQSSAVFYVLGTNDLIGAASGYVDTYEANLRHFWSRHSARRAGAPMFAVTPGPLHDDAYDIRASLIASRAASVVTSINDANLQLIDIRVAFPRKDATYYRNATDLVHWSNTGNAAVSAAITARLATLNRSI